MLSTIVATPVHFELFTTAKFAHLNKQDRISGYDNEIAADDYSTDRVKIVEIVTLTADEYEDFCDGLLEDRDWLAGKGGSDSTANVGEGKHFFQFTDDERKAWMAESYRVCVAVQSEGKRTLYVDPQGYNYARYVGI